MRLRTVVGVVKVVVWHGKDPVDKHWGCPIRERWGLRAHQQMSPALEEKVAFTATLVGSYEAAEKVAGKWGCPVDDSVIHALVQRVGHGAQAQIEQRLKEPAQEKDPQRGASELALLMLDGWFARFRGPGWGKKRTKRDRVEWHEVKNGVFYLHEQAARTEGGRGLIADKVVVRCLPAHGTGPTPALGGGARGIGTSQGHIGAWGRNCLDLESQNRPLVECQGVAGFLAWWPAPVGIGTSVQRDGRAESCALG